MLSLRCVQILMHASPSMIHPYLYYTFITSSVASLAHYVARSKCSKYTHTYTQVQDNYCYTVAYILASYFTRLLICVTYMNLILYTVHTTMG